MAHGKLISKRPFKPNIDSLLVKEVPIITAKETKLNVTDSNTTTSTSDPNIEDTTAHIIHKAPEEKSCVPSLKSEWSSRENFTHDQNIPKETEARKPENIQLTNILEPHQHDVLCGRGNYVNYHAGNQYYRSLVKKYFLKYVSSSKHEKPRYAELIYHEVGMRDPPGRFLRQDSDTKLWQDVGKKKALDKTRQALREGAPEVKSRVKYRLTNEEKLNLPGEQVDALSYNSTSSPPSPNDIIADYTGSSPLDRHMRPNAAYGQIHRQSSQTSFGSSNAHMQYQQINQTPPSNNGVSSTNGRLSALLYNNNVLNEDNTINSVGVNDCQAGKESRFATNTAAVNQAMAMASSVSYRLLNSNPNTVTNDNIANLVALGVLSVLNGRSNRDHSSVNRSSSHINTGVNGLRSESLLPANTISTRFNATNLNQKRVELTDDTKETRKRQKVDHSLEHCSATKEFGAAALLAMSSGTDRKSKSISSDSEGRDMTDPLDTKLPAVTSMASTSTLYSEHQPPRNILTDQSLIQGSSNDEHRLPTSTSTSVEPNGSQISSNSLELLNSSSIWTDKIEHLEKKWEISHDDSKTYPQRITAIKEKALQYRKRIKDAAVSDRENEVDDDKDNQDESQKIVELAEEKWGLIPSEGYNLAERVKMVEQTAISQIKRLQLWI